MYHRMIMRFLWASLLWVSCYSVVWADVGGTAQVLYRQHQVFGGAVSTGNTLMSSSLNNPLVNSRLLDSSPGDIQGIPFDAQLQGAYLFWSGSTLNTRDDAVDLTLPDGTLLNEVLADRCFDINAFGGFFYCRADVTQQVRQHPGVQNYNGQYVVGDLRAEPGTLQGNGTCVEPQECQAKYAAWSLILVYSAPSATIVRDVSIYDGFLQLDETSQSPGVASFVLSGFDFPADGQASVAFFGMEGDALLGVPPQDTDSNINLRCNTCFDFFEVNGNKLSDANNPANNLFNSSSVIGYTLGVDLDVFDISNYLRAGDQQINVRVGSGDGRVNPNFPDPGGGGELFLLGYVMVNVDRNAPNFSRDGTTFTVFPDEAAPLERVVLNLRIENEGSLTAQNVNTQVNLPNGLTYFPGSLRIDGVDPVPGNEVNNPLENGLNLGSIGFQSNSRRDIVLRASINDDVAAGTRLRSTATVSASNLMEDRNLEAIVTVLGTPPLTRPIKEVIDNDGDTRYTPGEIIQYSIRIPNDQPRPISGIRFVDQVPPYVDVLQVITAGQNVSDLARNLVQVEGINIGANQSTEIIIIAQIHDANQLLADGVPAGQIDGWQVRNQAEVSLGNQRLLSDDPNSAANGDATVFLIDAGVDIRGNGTRKSVTDLNGGDLEPGDELVYSIRIRNTGASGGIVEIDDVLPNLLTSCEILNSIGTFSCSGTPGNFRIQGESNIDADDLVRLDFRTQVSLQATDGQVIQNVAEVSVQNDNQNVTVRSPQLRVVARESLRLTKRVTSGNTVNQGGDVSYELVVTNIGNRPANNVQLLDPITFAVSDVLVNDGGQWIVNRSEVLWNLGNLATGESRTLTFTATLDASVSAGTVLSNQAQLNSDDLQQALLSDDPSTIADDDATLVTVQGSGAQLAFTKNASARNVQVGGTLDYILTVRNIGDTNVDQVIVDDPLPDGRFATRQAPQGIVRGNRVIFNSTTEPSLASLAPGESVDLVINTIISSLPVGTVIRNQARVIASGIDLLSDDPQTAEEQDATIIRVSPPPQINLLKQVEDLNGGAFEPGDLVRYTIQLTVSNGELSEVVIQDPIPVGLSNVVPLDAGVLQGGSVQWNIPEVNAQNRDVTVRFEAEIANTVQNQQVISNQANVSASTLASPVLSDDPNTVAADDATRFTVQSLPDLSASSKSVSPTQAVVGSIVNWEIVVRNQGRGTAQNVRVEDVLSDRLTEIEVLAGTFDAGVVRWNLGDLGPNQTRTLRFSSRIRLDTPADTVIRNQAQILSELDGVAQAVQLTDDLSTEALDDATQLTVLPSNNNISFSKSLAQADPSARAGSTVEYILTVSPLSGQNLNNVIIQDQLPAEISEVINSDGAVTNGNLLTWSLGNLNVGSVRELRLEVRLANDLPVGSFVSNQAQLTYDGNQEILQSDDIRTSEVNDPCRLQIIGDLNLQVDKEVSAVEQPAFAAGQLIRYQITVSNQGNILAENVRVIDPLPNSLQEIEDQSSIQGVNTPQGWTWEIDNLAPGAVQTFTLQARISNATPADTVISNQAQVFYEGSTTPFLSDDPTTNGFDATQFVVAPGANLRFDKTVISRDPSNNFNPGSAIEYRVTITNDGPGASEALNLVDILSPRLDNIAAQSEDERITLEQTGNQIQANIPSLSAGDSIQIVISATLELDLNAGDEVLNQAQLQTLEGQNFLLSDDPQTATAQDATRLVVAGLPRVTLRKSVSGDFAPGGEVTYQLTLTNTSQVQANDLQIQDLVPTDLTILQTNPPAQVSGQTIRWQVDRLNGGQNTTFTIQAVINERVEIGTEIENQASVSSTEVAAQVSDDPNTPVPNDPTRFTVSVASQLDLNKSWLDLNAGLLSPGDQVEFTLRVSNNGTQEIRNITIIDPISPILSDVEAIGGAVGSDNIARWQIALLQSGQSRTFNLRGRISVNAAPGDLMTNQFAARIGDEPFVLSNEVNANVAVEQIRLLKEAYPILGDTFVTGADFEYIITLINDGTTAVEQVSIFDELDLEQLSFIAASQGGVLQGNVLTWDRNTTPALRSIPAGGQVSFSIQMRVNETTNGGSFVNNQALARVANRLEVLSDDPLQPGLADVTSFVVSNGARLQFTKQVLRPQVDTIEAGDTFTYLIRIENVGTARSSVLVLGDEIEANMTATSLRVNGQSREIRDLLRNNLRLDPLDPGAVIECELEVRLNNSLMQGTVISNQATLRNESSERSALSDDPSTVVDNDPTRFTLGARPVVSMIKQVRTESGNADAVLNEVLTWTIEISNDGLAMAQNIALTDALPDSVIYLNGSMSLDGLLLTDQNDQDQAQFNAGLIRLNLPYIEPNSVRTFTFQTRASRVGTASNQAQIILANEMYVSDSDRNPNNGITPTVVNILDVPRKQYTITIEPQDTNGDSAVLNDVIDVKIDIENTGTALLADLDVELPIVKGFLFESVSVNNTGSAQANFIPQNNTNADTIGQVELDALNLGVEQKAELKVKLRIDPELSVNQKLCLQAKLTDVEHDREQDAGSGVIRSSKECLDAKIVFGSIAGQVYQDLNQNNRFDERNDLSFADMIVSVWKQGKVSGEPLATDFTDEQGNYQLDNLRPGQYEVRVKSSQGVFYSKADQVDVEALGQIQLALTIQPSGRVYHSLNGNLLDGAELFIYHDRDMDDDPFDQESLQQRSLVDPQELESSTQQGQRTAQGGMYRFDVKKPGRYLIEVIPPGVRFVSPSSLVPALPRFLTPQQGRLQVQDEAIPSVEPKADRRYVLAFEVLGEGDQVEELINNHIPLDPLSALIQIDKSSSRTQYKVGEIITYQVNIINRSPQDLMYDDQSRRGGVYLEDVLPKGLKFVPHSGLWSRVVAGKERPIRKAVAIGARILKFGIRQKKGKKNVLKPMTIKSGEHIRLRYQAVVGADAKPLKTYVNRATLLSDSDVPLSATAQAKIQVILDPDFDQGLMIGKVWCDHNKNEQQDEGEDGVVGAKIYIDHGAYAVTDTAGQYHFKQIDPGVHAVKIDKNTLYPRSELVTDETRVMYFTRGLPAKIDFGVTCPTEKGPKAEVNLGDKALQSALNQLGQEIVVMRGNVQKGTLSVKGLTFKAPQVNIRLLAELKGQKVADIDPLTAGETQRELRFKVSGFPVESTKHQYLQGKKYQVRTEKNSNKDVSKIEASQKEPTTKEGKVDEIQTEQVSKVLGKPLRWSLWSSNLGNPEEIVMSGIGNPPNTIIWSGQSLTGESMLTRGQILTYRLEVVYTDLMISSPLEHFGVGVTLPPEPEILLTFPTSTFSELNSSQTKKGKNRRTTKRSKEPQRMEMDLNEDDQDKVSQVINRLRKGYQGILIVEVHGSNESNVLQKTKLRAQAIAKKIARALKLKPQQIKAIGRGDDLPLVPNLTIANTRRNRRVQIRLEQIKPSATAVEQLNQALRVPAIVRSGQDEKRPSNQGNFVMTTNIPKSGLLETYLRDPYGRAITFSIPLKVGDRPRESQHNRLALTGRLGDLVSLGGRELDLKKGYFTLTADPWKAKQKTYPITIKGDVKKIKTWRLQMRESDEVAGSRGKVLQVLQGEGIPKSILELDVSALKPQYAMIEFQFTADEGIDGEAAPLLLLPTDPQSSNQIWGANQLDQEQWTLYINERLVSPDDKGQVNLSILVADDDPVAVRVVRPDLSITQFMYSMPAIKSTGKKEANSQKGSTLQVPSQWSQLWTAGGIYGFTRDSQSRSPLQIDLSVPSDAIETSLMKLPKTLSDRNAQVDPSQKPVINPLTGQEVPPMFGAPLVPRTADQPTHDSVNSNASISTLVPLTQNQGNTQTTMSSTWPSTTMTPQLTSNMEAEQQPIHIRRFGSLELLKASATLLQQKAPPVAAQDLEVLFPQGDTLNDLNAPIQGKTRPGNAIYINQEQVPVDAEGYFKGSAIVSDDGMVSVRAVDPDGNEAFVNRTYKIKDKAWFLLAFAESNIGVVGNELDGVQSHTSTKIGDRIYIHGRSVVYLKGRVKGDKILGGLFKKYKITAHVDSAKQTEFESYFREMINPEEFYPVYGDSATEVRDVNSRGPLYVLVQADQSTLQVGNFKTQIRGIELINYDRSLYGAQVNLNIQKGKWRHELKAFGADQDQPEKHVYIELRGTGGSLYYLPHRELVEGSERIYLIQRDKISNMELKRTALSRNIDYTIRYADGRLLMMSPVSSTSFDHTGALPQPTGSQNVLDGHPIFISVEYDHRDMREQGQSALGVYVRETWNNQFSIGGGMIQEQLGDVGNDHYRLWGMEMKYKYKRRSGIALEFAKSQNANGETLFSQDGGITFQPFNTRNQEAMQGQAFLVRVGAELDDFIGKANRDQLYIEGYWRYAAPGFYTGGNIQQQGSENYGGLIRYHINRKHQLQLKYDMMATEQTPFEVQPFMTDFRRSVLQLTHTYKEKRLLLRTSWTQTQNDQGYDATQALIPKYLTDTLTVSGEYKLNTRWTLLAEQEVVLRGDARLFSTTSDLLVSSLGARYRVHKSLSIEGIQSLRWSGDNATQIGIRKDIDQRRTIYSQHRFIDQMGQKYHVSVMGAEERWAKSARAYSEYQLETGIQGQRNRAVLGVGKRTQIVPGLIVDAAYQRSQVLNELGADLSQDALSLNLAWLAHAQLKTSNRIELRFDDQDEWLGLRDQQQTLFLNSISYKVNPDITLLLRFNYSHTKDLIFQKTSAEFMESSFGAAYRPIKHKWFAILLKLANRLEQRPVDLSLELPEREEMNVVSFMPIVELPFHFQLVNKIAYKRSVLDAAYLNQTVSDSILWITRLNFHITNTWDIGAEYRYLESTLAQNYKHGTLLEVNYIVKKKVRIGLGYNFSSFSDDEFARFNEYFGGPFFRLMANY